jgi:hypothetical protein
MWDSNCAHSLRLEFLTVDYVGGGEGGGSGGGDRRGEGGQGGPLPAGDTHQPDVRHTEYPRVLYLLKRL